MSSRKQLLCTLGPSSLRPSVIRELEAAGVTKFRINMSHTAVSDLDAAIRLIREATDVPICIDTEGAQIRTGVVDRGLRLEEGAHVRLVSEEIRGDESRIPITPLGVVERLEPSSRVSIDFDSVVLRVDEVRGGVAEAEVLSGGEVGSHKAVTALPSPSLPPFSQKDVMAVHSALERGIRQFALSFCESADSVRELRKLTGPGSTILAKIESREGVRRLAEIAPEVDSLIIDRGDLSRQVRLEAIPFLQKAIIRKANSLGVPVYVATNLLESMVTSRTPTRAEVNDVMNTLLDGADGLVLAAETAIGHYPAEAARMIQALLREYESSIDGYHIEDLLGEHPLANDPRTPMRPRERPG